MDNYIIRPNGDRWPEVARCWNSAEARQIARDLRKTGRDALCWKTKRSVRSIEEAPLFVVYAEGK